jgi:hypothetical protein
VHFSVAVRIVRRLPLVLRLPLVRRLLVVALGLFELVKGGAVVRERALALVHALEPLGQIEARLAREVVERHVPIPQLQAQHVPLVPREGAVGVTQLDREHPSRDFDHRRIVEVL